MSAVLPVYAVTTGTGAPERERQYVSFRLCEFLFGVEVEHVQEVLNPQRVAPVPLARPEVAGLLNLRGQIVTAISLRRRFGRGDSDLATAMNVVVRQQKESFSLLVDEVGDVVQASEGRMEPPPRTLEPNWRVFIAGVYPLEGRLLLVLDIDTVLKLE